MSNQMMSKSEVPLKEEDIQERAINSNGLVSVIIPVYNEEKTIKNVLQKLPTNSHLEIVLVDDGSTDLSTKKAKDLERNDIRIIKHPTNKGYGEAILTGFRASKGDIIVTLDSDGQHNPQEIEKVIEPLLENQADVVIGSRYLGRCYYSVPITTRIGEFMINLVLRVLFGLNIGNNQSGFRAFKRETLKFFSNMRNNGMGFTTELLFKSGFKNLRVIEVPIEMYPRTYGSSYVQLLRIMMSIGSCILHYFFKKLCNLKV